MDKRAIGVFDSGIGGLSCVKEIMRIMPNEDVIYFGDTGRVPYGSRSQETLMKYVRQDIRFLKSFDIKMIIIACGTASSAVLPWIGDELDLPILGVVTPAAQAAVKATKNKKIGVLGTVATVKYGKYVDEIKAVCPEAEVFQVTEIIAKEYLKEMKKSGVDTVILGCTHYPLLKDVIGKIMGEGVILIDSGAAAANSAHRLLKEKDIERDEKGGNYKYFVSDAAGEFSKLGGVFLEKPIMEDVDKIDIERY